VFSIFIETETRRQDEETELKEGEEDGTREEKK